MSHPIHKLSSLARPVEAKYPTNRAVLILLPLIAVIVFAHSLALADAGIIDALKNGVYALFTAFLAWAMGREADPDHNATAFIAMALAVTSILLGYSPALLTLAALLFAVRIVVRTVGPQCKPVDLATLIILSLGAVVIDGSWWIFAIATAALAIDEAFERSNLPQQITLAFSLGATVYLVGFNSLVDFAAMETLVRGWVVAVIVFSILYLTNVIGLNEVSSSCDFDGTPLNAKRIQLGALLIWLGACAPLLGGQASIAASLPIWSVIAASLVGRNLQFSGQPTDGETKS